MSRTNIPHGQSPRNRREVVGSGNIKEDWSKEQSPERGEQKTVSENGGKQNRAGRGPVGLLRFYLVLLKVR